MPLEAYQAAQPTGKPLVPTRPPLKVWVSSGDTGIKLSFKNRPGATLTHVPRFVLDTYDSGRAVTLVYRGAGSQTPRDPARGPLPMSRTSFAIFTSEIATVRR